MTPEEKLDLALRSYAAFNDLDADAVISLYAPDCEWLMTPSVAAMLGERFIGHDGLRSFVEVLAEYASSYGSEILESRIADDGNLLISGRNFARSVVVGAETESRYWQVGEFRDGLIWRVTDYEQPPPGWDTAEPLGLPQAEG